MSDIALRDYDYEIEAMIESGDIDEAIAHCKYILTRYPKHIAVYRLLGSALMHAERRSEAIQIYHRLLSALPDDFEAHYNLGLLYTDQGDVDPAVWHTLRAFELQPSNKSVHEKLRDLYAVRDGKAPQIRLTRPALARMYASQPDQTEQAVNEILSILADEPDRIDLEILLAQVYYQDQKYSEAEFTCVSILTRIPFCLEANLILAEVYDLNGQNEEAEMHWARVKEIDPYDKRYEKYYMAKNGLMVVDESSLPTLEDQEDQTAWQAETLRSIPDGIEISPLVTVDAPEAEIVTSPLGAADEDAGILNFNLEDSDEENDLVFNTDQDTLTWLGETPPGPTDTVGNWLEENAGEVVGQPAEQEPFSTPDAGEIAAEEELLLPDFSFLEEVDEGPAFIPHEDLPDWLKELPSPAIPTENIITPAPPVEPVAVNSDQEIPPETPAIPLEPEAGPPLPAWLINLAAKKEIEPKEAEMPLPYADIQPQPQSETLPEGDDVMQPDIHATEDLPDWLRELETLPSPEQSVSPELKPKEELPDWLRELETLPSLEQAAAPEINPKEELPDWLRELETLPSPEAATAPEVESIEELPAWLLELEVTPDIPAIDLPAPRLKEALPAWLRELEDGSEKPADTFSQPSPMLDMPSWLPEIEETPASELPEPESAGRREELPAWLRELEELPEEEYPQLVGIDELAPALEAALAEVTDAFSPADWSLPVEESAFSFEDTQQAGVAKDELPAWLKDLDEISEHSSESFEAAAADEEDTIWMNVNAEGSNDITVANAESQVSDGLPDWLKDLDDIENGTAPRPMETDSVAPSFQLADFDRDPLASPKEANKPETTPQSTQERIDSTLAGNASFVIESAASWTVDENEKPSAGAANSAEGIPDWLSSVEDNSLPGTDEMDREERILGGESDAQPEFGNIGAAIDWLENATALDESDAPDILPGISESEKPESMTEDMIDEDDLEISPSIQPMTAKWVLEANPVDLGIQARPQRETPHENVPQPQKRGLLNINKATLGQLEKLPGMGFRQAQNIINYRQIKGEIHSLEELRHVPKIDAKILIGLESRVIFTDPEPEQFTPAFEMSKIEILALAQAYFNQGNLSAALDQYSSLIANKSLLDEVIENLKNINIKSTQEIHVLEVLGEAYLCAERYEEALETYRQAEEFLQ